MRVPRPLVLVSLMGLAVLAAGCGSSASPVPLPPSSAGGSSASAASPSVPPIGANSGRWEALPAGPLPPLEMSVGVWTGEEIVITGLGVGPTLPARAAAYRPATRSWRTLPAPDVARISSVGRAGAVWTGRDVVVLGAGYCHAFDPAAGAWRRLSDPGNVAQSSDATLAWTGKRALVWGLDGRTAGWSIDPAADAWTALPAAPVASGAASGVWTGTELVVQSGAHPENEVEFEPPVAYDPAKNTWRTLPPMPEARTQAASVVWTGREVVVLGGTVGDDAFIPSVQVAYDPATNRWRTLTGGAGVAHGERLGQRAVWTGRQVLVWGGGRIDLTTQGAKFIAAPSGTAYDPAADTWVMLPKSPLQGRMEPVVVWTGTSLVVWGGAVYPGGSAVESKAVADGATYTP